MNCATQELEFRVETREKRRELDPLSVTRTGFMRFFHAETVCLGVTFGLTNSQK